MVQQSHLVVCCTNPNAVGKLKILDLGDAIYIGVVVRIFSRRKYDNRCTVQDEHTHGI